MTSIPFIKNKAKFALIQYIDNDWHRLLGIPHPVLIQPAIQLNRRCVWNNNHQVALLGVISNHREKPHSEKFPQKNTASEKACFWSSKKYILSYNHSIILRTVWVKSQKGETTENLFGQRIRLHVKFGNGKQDCRLRAEAKPQESHMTGVQEFVPFSVDKWEPLGGLKQKVPHAWCIK